MAVKPVQSAPNFNSGIANPMLAHFHYAQAKQAQMANQWQQVCVHAQACVVAARQDVKLRILAKELLAEGLAKTNQFEQACSTLLELDQLKPNDAVIVGNIGLMLAHLHQYQRAKAFYLQAIKLDPKQMQSKLNLGRILAEEARIDEAQQLFDLVLQFEPKNLAALHIIIFMQSYYYPLNMDRQMELLRRYASLVEGEIQPQSGANKRLLHSNKSIKVGFISGDLHEHPVGLFLESTLKQINADPALSDQLTLIAYHNHFLHDVYTSRLNAEFVVWHQVGGWTDEQLIAQIKRDQVDILFDLSGHTERDRLAVFAKQPAPLQISWLGYFGSTGLASIDYVLADPISVPESEEKWFAEKIWRLPHLRYCLSIPDDAPEVSLSPCIHKSEIVFGCYQATAKINDGVLKCWARILEACPDACIRIQSNSFLNQELKDQFLERLEKANIDIGRVDLIGKMTRKDYLSSYTEVDILLDTFPYPGGTTTAEALWMGVPTLTLALPSMLGRQGEALMMNAGLPDWIVYSEEEYVQKAIAWGNAGAQQRQALADLRVTLREQVRQSPVFEAKQFASDFVDALYGMWNEKYGS